MYHLQITNYENVMRKLKGNNQALHNKDKFYFNQYLRLTASTIGIMGRRAFHVINIKDM